jgi:hypothetical protein
LLFYPDGKRSSNLDHGQVYARAAPNIQILAGRDGDANVQNINPVNRDMRAEGNPGAALFVRQRAVSMGL